MTISIKQSLRDDSYKVSSSFWRVHKVQGFHRHARPKRFFWFFLLLFYSTEMVLCRVAAVKTLPVHHYSAGYI